MSNIYIQEPPTEGKVLLETTVGDIDIELWSRECPKACRNFVQLCMEGYYDKTIFHRLVKGFIVQGGDPTGSGTGGNSVWGKPFKDEIHSRLRFVRRGLVAMANSGRDDNGSQFFFTFGPTPELQNKHTIFGKIGGNTIYNMIKLEEGEIDENEKPRYPHKILKTRILSNPFSDIVPRASIKSLSREDKNKKQSSASAIKNYSLLSFGEEAEEEEEEIDSLNKQLSEKGIKGKSSHDLTADPKLSSKPAIDQMDVGTTEENTNKRKIDKDDNAESKNDDDDNDDDDDDMSLDPGHSSISDKLTVSSVKEKLQKSKSSSSSSKKSKLDSSSKSKKNAGGDASSEEEEYYLGKDEKEAEKKRVESIKKEFRDLKRTMKAERDADLKLKSKEAEVVAETHKSNQVLSSYFEEQKIYKEKKKTASKKGEDREAQTLALLAKFKNKIVSARDAAEVEQEAAAATLVSGTGDDPKKDDKVVATGKLYEDKDDTEFDPNDTSWLAKSLHNEVEESVLAKDANKKADDWYEIYDPKNPLNRRRREESKRAEGEKWKKLRPTD